MSPFEAMARMVEAGAEALAHAYPTLTEDFDFTCEWFYEAARGVLEAAEAER
jgi:hypothetical protein